MQNDSQALLRKQLEYENSRKSVGVAYMLWFFLGWLLAHRFYLRQMKGVLRIWGFIAAAIVFGLITDSPVLIIVGFWGLAGLLILDVFRIPSLTKSANQRILNQHYPDQAAE